MCNHMTEQGRKKERKQKQLLRRNDNDHITLLPLYTHTHTHTRHISRFLIITFSRLQIITYNEWLYIRDLSTSNIRMQNCKIAILATWSYDFYYYFFSLWMYRIRSYHFIYLQCSTKPQKQPLSCGKLH